MFFWCSPVKKPCRKLVQRIEKKHCTCIHQTPSQTSLKDRETFSVLRVEKALNSQVYIRFHDFFHVYGVGVWKGSSQIGRLFCLIFTNCSKSRGRVVLTPKPIFRGIYTRPISTCNAGPVFLVFVACVLALLYGTSKYTMNPSMLHATTILCRICRAQTIASRQYITSNPAPKFAKLIFYNFFVNCS